MKKYVISLAAMVLVIGGSINFVGCSGDPAEDPTATGDDGPPAIITPPDPPEEED